jgi:hypothetical protein
MFWSRKAKSPITEEDEQWIISSFQWFETAFGKELTKTEIYLPTKQFFDFEFIGTEDDALDTIGLVAEKMGIDASSIEVYFFEEFQPIDFTDEGVYSNYEEGTELINGEYSKVVDGLYQIGIERSLLKNPEKLIATVAHELAHIKLLGEEKLEQNDEPLTDFSASLFGFVIFLANNSISKMETWSGNSHTGWRVGGTSGYLHYKIYGFLIAYWMLKRNESNPAWLKFVDSEIVGVVKKSLKFLEENKSYRA